MLFPEMSEVVGLVGALGKVFTITDAAADAWVTNARTCRVYCVLAVKPVNWYSATSPAFVQAVSAPPFTS